MKKQYIFFVLILFLVNCELNSEVSSPQLHLSRSSAELCINKNENHNCHKYCSKIYTYSRSVKQKCKELSVVQIENLFSLNDLLNTIDLETLKHVREDDFKHYLEFSFEGMLQLIATYNKVESKKFILWILENENIFNIFKEQDVNYRALDSLLYKIKAFDSSTNTYKPFIERIDGTNKLMERIIYLDESFLVFFMKYIHSNNEECRNHELKDCFKVYCKIGDQIDSYARQEWINHEKFREYIDGIIENQVNSGGNCWNKGQEDVCPIKTSEDLDEDWFKVLCQGLVLI